VKEENKHLHPAGTIVANITLPIQCYLEGVFFKLQRLKRRQQCMRIARLISPIL